MHLEVITCVCVVIYTYYVLLASLTSVKMCRQALQEHMLSISIIVNCPCGLLEVHYLLFSITATQIPNEKPTLFTLHTILYAEISKDVKI